MQVHNPYNPLYPAQPGYQDLSYGTNQRTGYNNYNQTRQGMPGDGERESEPSYKDNSVKSNICYVFFTQI